MGPMERHGGAESSGTSEIPEHCLRGSCLFSSAVTGVLEAKGGCELPMGEHLGNCWVKHQQVTPEAGQWSWFPVQCFQLLRHRAESQETHIHVFVDEKCWDLTACLGQTLEGFQIQSQVVEHTWHESKKSTSHMPLWQECSAGACCKNFLGQCRYLQGFLPSGTYGF